MKVSYNKKLSQSFIKAKYCISSVERQRGGDKAPRVGEKKRRNSDFVGVRFLPQTAALTLLGSNLGKFAGPGRKSSSVSLSVTGQGFYHASFGMCYRFMIYSPPCEESCPNCNDPR